MKKLFVLGLLVLSATGASAAQFQFEKSSSSLTSASLRGIFNKVVAVQSKSAQHSVLGAEGVVIKDQNNQSDIKMVRQLLHVHFRCNSSSTTVEASLATPAAQSAYLTGLSGWDAEPSSHTELAKQAASELAQTQRDLSDRLQTYSVSYSGGGQCERGIEGVLIVDKKASEAVLYYRKWEH